MGNANSRKKQGTSPKNNEEFNILKSCLAMNIFFCHKPQIF